MAVKQITISCCVDCLVFSNDSGGNKPHCNHPSVMSKRPYAPNRQCPNPTEAIPAFCPLSDLGVV